VFLTEVLGKEYTSYKGRNADISWLSRKIIIIWKEITLEKNLKRNTQTYRLEDVSHFSHSNHTSVIFNEYNTKLQTKFP
jgi:hypothetical protein